MTAQVTEVRNRDYGFRAPIHKPIGDLAKEIPLSEARIKKALQLLESRGLISTKGMGYVR